MVKGFPNDYKTTEQDALNFFESKFGWVHEVVFAREWGKIIKRFWKRIDLNKQIKLWEIKNKVYLEGEKVDENQVKQNESKLQKLKEKSEKYDLVLEKWYPKDKLIYYEDLRHMYAFVVFEDPRDMRKAKWSLK